MTHTEEYLKRVERLAKTGKASGDIIPRYHAGHKYVAVIGGICDWAVYTGFDNWNWAEIASNGDKISGDEATKIYPELVEMELPYRG